MLSHTPVPHDYTELNIYSYKQRLALALVNGAVSSDMLLEEKNGELRKYITNYVEEVFKTSKVQNDIERVTYKLVNSSIHGIDNDNAGVVKTYPLINKFKGHLLVETFYFKIVGQHVIVDSVPFLAPGPTIIQ